MLELLSPAGDFECLQSAVDFGCNAVYLGGKLFGMRAASKNFDEADLKRAVEYAHSRGVKVHMTCNILPNNEEIELFPEYIRAAAAAGIDAVIVCDLGVLSLVKKYAPELEVHMSTQTGIVNYMTANELHKMGVKRVVLARELSLDSIKTIRDKTPPELEIEAFVHGAMCVSFSGRCLLSAYLVGRDANHGQCAQPCRWSYSLVEEKRPNDYYPVVENERGTYILNAQDMCMIENISELKAAGISSLKIEGRAKSAYYVAVVTNAYRAAIDAAERGEAVPEWAIREVSKVSHRPYCTGFYYGEPKQHITDSGYSSEYDFVGTVDGCENGILSVTQRNYFTTSDELEVLAPGHSPQPLKPEAMFNCLGEPTEIANHAMEKLTMKSELVLPPHSLIRKPSVKGK